MGTKKKDYDVAVNLYDSGLSIQDVADFYGVSRQSMWMVLKRRGCEFRSNLKYGKDNHFFRNGCTAPDRIHNIVELAVEKGLLTRKTHCEKCNATGVKINAHHKDYNKPLEVDWLCSDCHYAWHKDNKAVELNIDFPTMSRTEICRRGGARKEVTTDELQQRIENATKTTILTAGVP